MMVEKGIINRFIRELGCDECVNCVCPETILCQVKETLKSTIEKNKMTDKNNPWTQPYNRALDDVLEIL